MLRLFLSLNNFDLKNKSVHFNYEKLGNYGAAGAVHSIIITTI